MYRRVFFGPCDNPENMGLLDLGLREKAVVLALLIPIVWIGVYPNPFLTRLEASVGDLLHHMERTASAARSEAQPSEVHQAALPPGTAPSAIPRRHDPASGKRWAASARSKAQPSEVHHVRLGGIPR